MPAEIIAVAADHAGFDLKLLLKQELEAAGYNVMDLGTHDREAVDYPDFGRRMAAAIRERKVLRGVLVCGTGIGISIAANRDCAVRAAACHDVTSARLAREHNDANVLALGARLIGPEVARQCLHAFLETAFAGGRHAPRVAKLAASA